MRRLTLLLLAALLLAPCAWAATCPACSTYAIVLRPGFEAEAVMPVLSGIAGAELQQESARMIVSTTPARARLLAADGRVASVERIALRAETNTVESWSTGLSYAYDGAGSITAVGSNAYVYDTAGRLVSGTVGGASNSQEFSYDAFGNRKSATRTGTACKGGFDCESSPAVDPATNRLKRSTTAPAAPDITYDQAGNLTMLDVSHTYTYDALGSMTKQVDGAATREYVYTADDERLGVYNGTWDWTVRDLGGRVLREYTSTGASGTSNWKWRRDHVYRGSQLLATVNQKYDANDNAVTGTTTYHLHLDHLGTPRLITDATGLLLSEHAYYPFGPELNLPPTESPRDPQQYTGHERDDIADMHGLDYMHARYYGAAVGRFLSVDPVLGNPSAPQSWNRYAYVSNNPLGRTDPTGRQEAPPEVMALIDEEAVPIEEAVAESFEADYSGVKQAVQIGYQAVNDATTYVGARFPGWVDAARGWLQGETGTPSPPSTQIAKNAAQGKLGEKIVGEQLVKEGKTILGSQVSANTKEGRRVIDHLVQSGNTITAVEVKTGGATRNASQIAKDTAMAAHGATLFGKNAPSDLKGKLIKLVTEVRNIF